jgi:C1A family cysteine protease
MGWLHDPPDIRDYWIDIPKGRKKGKEKTATTAPKTLSFPSNTPKEKKLGGLEKSLKGLTFAFPSPEKHLTNVMWCSPIEDQGTLGSCTAQAGVGLLEYFERRSFGKHIEGSRRFLYKVTRNLLGWTGDTGAYCRTTMGAMAMLGVSLEKYWPYTTVAPDFDEEPSSLVYSLAQNYQGLTYHRLDVTHANPTLPLLDRIKLWLAAGWPLMFGFSVYSSIFDSKTSQTGEIPFPTSLESRVGGHAVVAVGYDNAKKIENTRAGATATTGAFLIRNSWGTDWGCVPPEAPAGTTSGYGWLPYEYLLTGQARDWWSMTKAEWIDSGQF